MSDPLRSGVPGCANCLRLERRIADLEQRLRELEERLGRNASNSSLPPSANPPSAPKPVVKKPTGRRPGGQVGHPGHHRKLLPIEQVDRFVVHQPRHCQGCGRPIPPDTSRQLIGRHQISELPHRAVYVSEHQAYACRCPACGQINCGSIPPDLLRRCTGPRLSAAIGLLCAKVHGSRRAVQQVLEQVLGVRLSLGSLMARQREMTLALGEPYRQAKAAVQAAAAKNVDETGWKRAARYLWVAASSTVAALHIDRCRNRHAMQALLGEQPEGTICSDRYGVYDYVPLSQRAICWAHLKRDFQQCVDRAGRSRSIGQQGLKLVKSVVRLWRKFRAGRIDRPTLQQRLQRHRGRMRRLLKRGVRLGLKKTSCFCAHLLRLETALWRFAEVEGIEPTNNHAERMLRPAVIWRKISLGSASLGGCRFVERILTAIHTLQLQGRGVMQYLQEAVAALRAGRPAPPLVA